MLKEYSENDPNITILDKGIIVFHNVLEDPDAYIDHYEENGNWRGWYGFGRQIDARGNRFQNHPTFPSWDDWEDLLAAYEKNEGVDNYRREVAEAFYSASKFYKDYAKPNLPNWSSMAWGLARYIPDEDLIDNPDLTMNYHTDYRPDDAETPGDKFAITCVLYPNDEYEGGEISFRIWNSDDSEYRTIDYKPRAGDMVFFPAAHPYYHGVKRMYGAPKYITRIYWLWHYEGSEDYHALKEKYGDAFEDLEMARRKRHDLMIMHPQMKYRFTLKEYYDLLESGQLLDHYE